MSDSSRARFLISPETLFAETPATGPGPTMQDMRFTTEGLKHGNETAVSEEIRDDRSISDVALVGYNAAGPLNYQFSAGTFDALIEAALCGAWTSDVVKNGVQLYSWLGEVGLLDVGQFFYFPGLEIDEWNLSIDPKRIISGNFTFMGTRAFRATTTRAGTITPKTVTPLISAGPFITGLAANTNMTGLKFRSLKLQVKNNLRVHDGIDSMTTDQHGRGMQDVTGSFEVYFKTAALYDQFLANGAIDFSFTIGDGTKSYTFRMPKLKLPNVGVDVGARDTDVVQPVDFRALYDDTLGCHLQITRVP